MRPPAALPFRAVLRQWHRWTSIAAAILLGWIVITGTVLAIEFYLNAPPRRPAASTIAAGGQALSPAGTAGEVERVTRHLASQAPAQAALELRLDLTGAGPAGPSSDASIRTGYGQEIAWKVVGDRLTHQAPIRASTPSPENVRLHNLLIALHTGSIIGLPGRLLDCLGGAAFLFLSLSGLWLYIDMYRQRCRAGRGTLPFWKG